MLCDLPPVVVVVVGDEEETLEEDGKDEDGGAVPIPAPPPPVDANVDDAKRGIFMGGCTSGDDGEAVSSNRFDGDSLTALVAVGDGVFVGADSAVTEAFFLGSDDD